VAEVSGICKWRMPTPPTARSAKAVYRAVRSPSGSKRSRPSPLVKRCSRRSESSPAASRRIHRRRARVALRRWFRRCRAATRRSSRRHASGSGRRGACRSTPPRRGHQLRAADRREHVVRVNPCKFASSAQAAQRAPRGSARLGPTVRSRSGCAVKVGRPPSGDMRAPPTAFTSGANRPPRCYAGTDPKAAPPAARRRPASSRAGSAPLTAESAAGAQRVRPGRPRGDTSAPARPRRGALARACPGAAARARSRACGWRRGRTDRRRRA